MLCISKSQVRRRKLSFLSFWRDIFSRKSSEIFSRKMHRIFRITKRILSQSRIVNEGMNGSLHSTSTNHRNYDSLERALSNDKVWSELFRIILLFIQKNSNEKLFWRKFGQQNAFLWFPSTWGKLVRLPLFNFVYIFRIWGSFNLLKRKQFMRWKKENEILLRIAIWALNNEWTVLVFLG